MTDEKVEINVIEGFNVKIGFAPNGDRIIGLHVRVSGAPAVEFILEKDEAEVMGQALLGACAYELEPEEKAQVEKIIKQQAVH